MRKYAIDIMSNIYYHPEKHNLQIVYEHEFSQDRHGFDKRVVWKHCETGKYYSARCSGCSCPSPFEKYEGIHDLEEIRPDMQDYRLLDIQMYKHLQ